MKYIISFIESKKTIGVLLLSMLFFESIGQIKKFTLSPYNDPESSAVQANCKNEADANIIFFTQIEGIKFEGEINDQRYNVDKQKYILCVNPNLDVVIKITHKNFAPITKMIKKLSPGEVVYFIINSDDPIAKKDEKEVVSKGEFTLISEPSGADITIEGIPSFNEKTPYIFKGYIARSYKLYIKKENYKTSIVNITIDANKSGSKSVNLDTKKGLLTLKVDNSNANDADILIDSKNFGKIQAITRIPLDQGEHNLVMQKKGFSTINKQIKIKENEETFEPIQFVSTKEISITSNVKKGNVFLDMDYVGKTPISFDLSIGNHSIKVEKHKFYDDVKNISITENSANSQDLYSYLNRHHKVKIKGGPSNAFLSMILPGWGDYYVNKYRRTYSGYNSRNKKKYGYVIPVAYLLCGYGALLEYSQYQTNYSLYHNANSQSLIDNYYSLANTHFQNTQLYLGAAAAIWLADIIYVTSKGFQNRHHEKRYSSNGSSINFYYAGTNNNFQIGLSHKF